MSEPRDEPNSQMGGLLAAVMASCRDAIIACSLDGVIEAWNSGAEEVYGHRRSEAIGADAGLTIPPERRDELQRLVTAAKEGRSIEHFDTVRIRKSGQAFPAAVCGFPIRNDHGEVTGYATIERDASGRVEAADALRDALSKAQEASQAKSRFLANASHELRTPMNAIVGMTALALEEKLTPELRDYLETIRDSADSMLHLVNDVLDLSKFESDQFELESVAFDPRELVEGTVRVLGSAAHAKGLELVCHVAQETPEAIVGDPVRLRQVLTNLVSNAVKFTASGDVVVDVVPIAIEKRRCLLRFRVTDTGIGIPEDDLERIFSPFTQVDGATTRRYSGTGLGLTITQHLIDRFGAELEVESHVGKGSCFTFTLKMPLAETHDDEASEAAVAKLRGLSVLVVDDNEASREALVEQFTAWDMRADAVPSGKLALQQLREASEKGAPYDLAVIDALMPGVDGFSVASRIEGDNQLTTKPVLMASTTDRLEFSRRCAEAGAVAFVQKPVGQSQLLGAVVQASGAASLDRSTGGGLFDHPNGPPLRVLLAEDTPANRKVVQSVLGKRGHHLEAAVNGREAIDAFRNNAYDLVLMDVQMPIMDGLQATEAIREMERSSGTDSPIPIVAMTAHSLRGDRERCFRAGMDGYLSKPLDLEQLIDTVEKFGAATEQPPSPEGNPMASQPTSEESQTADRGVEAFTPSVVNLEAALARLRGDRDLLLDMMGFYLEDAPELLATIQASLTADDLTDAQRAAHSLKGLAATFGAEGTVDAAREVELATRDGKRDDLPLLAKRLEVESKRLSDWLESYRSKSSNG